jgi:hypothetical protein
MPVAIGTGNAFELCFHSSFRTKQCNFCCKACEGCHAAQCESWQRTPALQPLCRPAVAQPHPLSVTVANEGDGGLLSQVKRPRLFPMTRPSLRANCRSRLSATFPASSRQMAAFWKYSDASSRMEIRPTSLASMVGAIFGSAFSRCSAYRIIKMVAFPPGRSKASPTARPIIARASGDKCEIVPRDGSASSSPTI